MSHSPPARLTGKLLTVSLGIAAVLAALTFLLREPPSTLATPPADPFAAIPAPTGSSASEQALAEALAEARATPQLATAWVTLGDTLAQRLRDSGNEGFYDSAEQAYRQALKLDPRSANAMNGMAWAAGGRHDFTVSVAWANKSLAASPDNADALGILGDVALELGHYDEAFTHYQKMTDARPDLSSWSRGAYLLWINGETTRATALMGQAIRAGSAFAENTAWCRARLANMHFHQGAYATAAQVLEPSLRAKSKNPHILLAAARIATASDELEIAAEYYRMLNDLAPNHDALAGLGDLHAAQGRNDEAEKFYLQVEALHATNLAKGVHDHIRMAAFLADHDRDPAAAVKLASQHRPTGNVFDADTLAWVHFKNGDNARAIEAIKLALSRHTPDAGIHYHAGLIAAQAGDVESARRHRQTALSLNPIFSLLQAPRARKALEAIATRNQATITGN